MRVTLINPNLVVQQNAPFTTGVVYMPSTIAYLAAVLREKEIAVQVIDAFGEKPEQVCFEGKFCIFGRSPAEIVANIAQDSTIVFVYAINLTNHLSISTIIKAIKKNRPSLNVVVLENTQAVTAYALRLVADEFYKIGADYILTGEPEERAVRLVNALGKEGALEALRAIDGVGGKDFFNPPENVISDLDRLPFPAWDLFPLGNYWKIRFAHGPQTSRKYLPLLTSRGCPYSCRFCVVPATNGQRWRARSGKNVVDEVAYASERFGVKEFHIEDLDPTIRDERIREICREIIERNLGITWKIAAGTKIETIRDKETIDLMAQAGCRYISLSPETGSPRLLKLMRKPFDLEHAIRLVKRMNETGIRSQACFVLGFPTETEEDLKMTSALVKRLTCCGVDEIALFMITPVPGSDIYKDFQGYKSFSELNFTPTWRPDYKALNRFRLELYAKFLFWKFQYYPLKVLWQISNFLRCHFETKMEMVPYRAMIYRIWSRKSRWKEIFSKQHATS